MVDVDNIADPFILLILILLSNRIGPLAVHILPIVKLCAALTLSFLAPHRVTGALLGVADVGRILSACDSGEVAIRALVAIDGHGG